MDMIHKHTNDSYSNEIEFIFYFIKRCQYKLDIVISYIGGTNN